MRPTGHSCRMLSYTTRDEIWLFNYVVRELDSEGRRRHGRADALEAGVNGQDEENDVNVRLVNLAAHSVRL